MKIEFLNKALWFKIPSSEPSSEGKKAGSSKGENNLEKILVIGDVHIGYEEALEKQGGFTSRSQFEETMKDIRKIFEEIKASSSKDEGNLVKEIIILGDLKHEFGEISSQEWRETLKFLDFLKENAGKIILVRGNHDKILEPIAKVKNLEIYDFYKKQGICFIHGNRVITDCFDKDVKMIVAGHRHPAVVLEKGAKRETYKCFLVGKFKGKKLILIPSFLPLIEGTDVIREDDYETALNLNFKNFEVFIVGDRVYDFGKLRDLKKMN
jgi:putative SbcD/Mre11-related phosphoesterase